MAIQRLYKFTWFPGYACGYLNCAYCEEHIGWKYISQKTNLIPRYFYGLSSMFVRIKSDLDAESTLASDGERVSL